MRAFIFLGFVLFSSVVFAATTTIPVAYLTSLNDANTTTLESQTIAADHPFVGPVEFTLALVKQRTVDGATPAKVVEKLLMVLVESDEVNTYRFILATDDDVHAQYKINSVSFAKNLVELDFEKDGGTTVVKKTIAPLTVESKKKRGKFEAQFFPFIVDFSTK